MQELEPPDLERCQCDFIKRLPWAMGGTHRTDRCTNKPSVIVTETKAGKDGQCGSMSLCDSCLKIFKEQFPTKAVKYRSLKFET